MTSHSTDKRTVLKSLVRTTLTLLLNDVNARDNREWPELMRKLVERIDQHQRCTNDKLLTSLTHLKTAVVGLRNCIENPNERSSEENSTSQNELPEDESVKQAETSYPDTQAEHFQNDSQRQLYTQKHVQLQKDVSQIKLSNEFVEAMKDFSDAKDTLAEVFETDSERETKIMATKICVVSEILGNLTNPRAAAEKCIEYILELHKIFKLQKSPFPTWYKALSKVKLEKIFESQEMKGLDSAVHVNVVVFSFIREFLTIPVAMLNWTTINIVTQSYTSEPERLENQNRPEEYTTQKIHHPILGEQPPKSNKPDPFTPIEIVDDDGFVWMGSQVSAVNCCGEVFLTKTLGNHQKPPMEILKIIPSGNIKKYCVDNERKRNILSISIDCTTNCNSSEASCCCKFSFSMPHTPCKGNLYVLAASGQAGKRVRYFLYVINVDETIHNKEQLAFLESDQILQAMISCIKEEKLVILDITSSKIYICNNKGKHFKTIALTAVLSHGYFRKSTKFTISYDGEIVCSEERSSKLNIWNIDEENSSLENTNTAGIKVKKLVVQSVAFNNDSNELIILGYTSVFSEYHLVIYTKAGELKEDIKLQNGDYRDAKLIFNQSGRVVLLNKFSLLHLK